MHFVECLRAWGKTPGCHLTTSFVNDALPSVPAIDAPAVPKKRGWLPLLTVLFLISYGLMTMLIVEQGRTIESQHLLIRELFRDSAELSAVKMKASLSAKTQAPSTQNPKNEVPKNRIPENQAPSRQAPSSQAAPQHGTQKPTARQKIPFRMPSKPASDLMDDRRALNTI